MAKLPVFFTASTKAIAEKAIQRGILKYPGLCYIEDGNVIAWMTEDNEIRYTKGVFLLLLRRQRPPSHPD